MTVMSLHIFIQINHIVIAIPPPPHCVKCHSVTFPLTPPPPHVTQCHLLADPPPPPP